jgi:hypothetical protein
MGVAGNAPKQKTRGLVRPTAAGYGAVTDVLGQGAPTNGTSGTGAGVAERTSTYFDYLNGVEWVNVGTKASPVWSPQQPVVFAITSATILAMYTASVPVIAAPPTGYCLLVQNILFEMIATATAYANGGVVTFEYHGGSVASHTGSVPASVINAGSAGTTFTQLGPATGSNGTTIPTATGIDITNASGLFITGTGTAKAFISYSVIPE